MGGQGGTLRRKTGYLLVQSDEKEITTTAATAPLLLMNGGRYSIQVGLMGCLRYIAGGQK